jgi:hypothetical protein
MYRVVIYGYAIPTDHFMGKGSGTLVDMTYFTDEPVYVHEIFNRLEQEGFFMIAKKSFGSVVQDRITVEEINIGIDQVRY